MQVSAQSLMLPLAQASQSFVGQLRGAFAPNGLSCDEVVGTARSRPFQGIPSGSAPTSTAGGFGGR